jgi:hypothetical protein
MKKMILFFILFFNNTLYSQYFSSLKIGKSEAEVKQYIYDQYKIGEVKFDKTHQEFYIDYRIRHTGDFESDYVKAIINYLCKDGIAIAFQTVFIPSLNSDNSHYDSKSVYSILVNNIKKKGYEIIQDKRDFMLSSSKESGLTYYCIISYEKDQDKVKMVFTDQNHLNKLIAQ